MTTFADLKSEVQDLVIDLPTRVQARVGDYVNRAVEDLQVKYNFRVMRALHEVNTVVATRSLGNLPSNWKEPRLRPWYKDQTGNETPLEWIGDEDEELYKQYATTDANDKGPPSHLFARDIDDLGTKRLEVYPFPDGLSDWTSSPVGEYRMVLPYYKFLAVLSGDTDANWFTNKATEYIVHQAAGHAFTADWDEQRAAVHFQLAITKERKPKRLDAAYAGPSERVLSVRADVRGFRNAVGWRY